MRSPAHHRFLLLASLVCAWSTLAAPLAPAAGQPSAQPSAESSIGMEGVRAAIERRDLQATMQAVDAVLADDPSNVDALMIKARYLRREGKAPEAGEIYRQILDIEPGNVQALIDYTLVALAQGQLIVAGINVEQLEQIEPGFAIPGYLRGLIALNKNEVEQGIQLIQESISGLPESSHPGLLAGVLDAAEDDLDKAQDYLGRIHARLPDNLAVSKLLAEVRLKLGDGDGALEALATIPEDRRDPQVMAMLGSAYLIRHDTEKGIAWIRRAVQAAPQSTVLRMQLARALLAAKDPAGAVDILAAWSDPDAKDIELTGLLIIARVQAGDVPEALRLARAIEGAHPRSPKALDLSGYAHLASGDLDGAVARFKQALDIDPKYAAAHINLARADVAAKRPDRAQQRLETFLRGRAPDLGAQLELATIARALGDEESERAWLETAQKSNRWTLEPGLRLVRFHLARQNTDAALEIIRDLKTRAPGSREVALLEANVEALSGKPTEAIALYQEQLEGRPHDPQTLLLLASAQWKAADLDSARETLARAIEIDPSDLGARMALASLELQSRRDEAALDLAQAIQHDFPDRPNGYVVEAKVHDAMGRPTQAADAYQKAFQLPGGDAVAMPLATALYSSGRPSDAIPLLLMRVRQQPQDTAALLLLGLAYQASGEDKAAILRYEQARELAPDHVGVLNNLAWLYRQQRDPRALATAARAYELAPDNTDVADTYGWILLGKGETDDALRVLEHAHASAPESTTIAYHLAVALAGSGDKERARTLLDGIIDVAPESTEAKDARDLLDAL